MKKVLSFFVFLLSATYFVNAENKIYVGATEKISDGDDNYHVVEICLDNTDEIANFGFDVVIPAGYTFTSGENTEKGRLQVKSGIKWTDTFTTTVVNQYADLATVVSYSTETVLESGSGSIITLYFLVSGEYVEDFYFNNANCSKFGGSRNELKFCVGALGKNGYSSYCSDQDVKINGAEAFYASVDEDGETIVLKQATDGIVANRNGVILKGVEGTPIYATSLAEAPAAPGKDENVLSYTLVGTKPESPVHVLSTNDGVTGFYTYSDWIPAGKAYLEGYTSGNYAKIRFEDETGIEEISAEGLNGVIFNLNGQKVNEVKKGIHIVNGKKVMF